MILLEELKNCVHPAIKNYIAEQRASTLSKAAEMAEEYFLSHKRLLQKGSPQQTFQKTFHSNKNRFEVSSSSPKTTDSKPFDAKSTFHKSSWNSSQDHPPYVFIVDKRVTSFLSVLQDKETKRQGGLPEFSHNF